ncbi:hypothetical protein KJ596_00950 [Patescibacteria group bacterium]|nr:hypothetical protein [Patescibacteria group bacterium]MBU1868806.1 hypothetical protein [Patescibacteria group bacterium]
MKSGRAFVQSKKFKLGILILFLVFAFTIITLEILMRRCPLKEIDWPSCYDLRAKYAQQEFLPDPLPPMPLQELINNHIIIVPREEIAGSNGIACTKYGYIANDLPYSASKFVATHEAIHLQGEVNETITNIKAGLRQPMGLIQTTIYSLFYSFRSQSVSEYPCVFGKLWQNFRTYFLNLPYEQPITLDTMESPS